MDFVKMLIIVRTGLGPLVWSSKNRARPFVVDSDTCPNKIVLVWSRQWTYKKISESKLTKVITFNTLFNVTNIKLSPPNSQEVSFHTLFPWLDIGFLRKLDSHDEIDTIKNNIKYEKTKHHPLDLVFWCFLLIKLRHKLRVSRQI